MFSKEAAKTTTANGTPALNMISEGTSIKGDIESENDLRVSGTIHGEASSKGKVIVTSTGKIEGNIKASNADIAGNMEGELFISGKLVLRKTAVVSGDIHTKTILVEEGAQITGNCNMGVENAPGSSSQNARSGNKSLQGSTV